MAVAAVNVEVFELRGGGEQDVRVVRGVGLELLVDDGEEVVAFQAGEYARLIGADGGGVRIVNEECLHGRAGKFSVQGFGEARHVHGAGAGANEVRAFEEGTVEVVGLAGAEEGTRAGMSPVAGECGEAHDGSHGHSAASVPLEAVVESDKCRAAEQLLATGVLLRESLDVFHGQAGDPRCDVG